MKESFWDLESNEEVKEEKALPKAIKSGRIQFFNSPVEIMVTEDFLTAINSVLSEYEEGLQILYEIGTKWGEKFYRRMDSYITSNFGESINDLEVELFLKLLNDYLLLKRWAEIELSNARKEKQFYILPVYSPLAYGKNFEVLPTAMLLSGFFTGVFSSLIGKGIRALEITSFKEGEGKFIFLVSTAKNIAEIEKVLKEKPDYKLLLNKLGIEIESKGEV